MGGVMLKRIFAALLVGIVLSFAAPAAEAAPSMCEIMYKLGVRNVRECEDPTS